MIELLHKEDCNGCCACVDICPTKAIQLQTDEEGFWYPETDKNVCNDCGLCNSVCPELHVTEVKKNDFEKPFAYAAVHKNLDVRFNSTSGGLFSAMAEIIYKNGGNVAGAVYNDDFSVKHYISNTKSDLQKLRSSKYQQSNMSGIHREIKRRLDDGENVLVCGTPCQMAALRLFLKKDYDNLIILDFVCRGVNSPMVFQKYLQSQEEANGAKIVAAQAKNKELGWRSLTFKMTFDNGKSVFQTKESNLFLRGYLSANAYCRPSCYTCQFKGWPRIADITLADFWGIEQVDASLDNDLGTSIVLVNSKKGAAFFENIKEKINFREVSLAQASANNGALITPLKKPTIDRKQFFAELQTASFEKVATKYFPPPSVPAKEKIREFLGTILTIAQTTRLHPKTLYQFVKYNFLSGKVNTNIRKQGWLITTPHSVLEIHKRAKIDCKGTLYLGMKRIKKSRLESRLLVDPGGEIVVNGDFIFGYGSDIEVFKNAKLILNENGATNISTTIICAERIEIGKHVRMGRNVTIRDTNGNHFLALQGYKPSRPVTIGDHVWLCEGCTILPGVKIGDGAIIGACSTVVSNVPANAIVMGNPAKVVDENILWKF